MIKLRNWSREYMDAPKNEKLSITIENIDKYEKAAIMYFLWSMEILGNIGASGIILFSCGKGEDCRPVIRIDDEKIPNMDSMLNFGDEEIDFIFRNYKLALPNSNECISPNAFYMLMNHKEIINEDGIVLYSPKSDGDIGK